MKKILTLCLLLALPLLGMAQRPTLDRKQLLKDVEVLSADAMQGRQSGSEGSKKAQDYLLKRFRQVGLKPFGKSYKQHFRIESKRLTSTGLSNFTVTSKCRMSAISCTPSRSPANARPR